MTNYYIEIKNCFDSVIYTRTIKATSATKALLNAIASDNVILDDGDTINITKMEIKRVKEEEK